MTEISKTALFKHLHVLAKEMGLSHDDLHDLALKTGKVESLKDISKEQCWQFIQWLTNKKHDRQFWSKGQWVTNQLHNNSKLTMPRIADLMLMREACEQGWDRKQLYEAVKLQFGCYYNQLTYEQAMEYYYIMQNKPELAEKWRKTHEEIEKNNKKGTYHGKN